MFLVVGLGNPGPEYAQTRHNAGFMVVDRLARELNIPVGRRVFFSLTGRGQLEGRQIMLAKPMTYMNESGRAVAAIMRWHRLTPADLLVVSDDLDLPVGRIRLRRAGGHGGHRGLQSIIQHLGTNGFARLRMGIGRPVHEGMDVVDWVLGRFTPEEGPLIEQAVAAAAEAVRVVVTVGLEEAMNRFNAGPVR
ncbi:MAG TPA: aminoacyl-tRNA hydrolase [Desulfotomaculum sp.]|nr:aminoacyl-tRNA hydrolase [Desulfotomaculum sp.]